MPMCAAVMPRPGCKHVMTKEKNERGCPKYPCGKVECEPEIIGRPEEEEEGDVAGSNSKCRTPKFCPRVAPGCKKVKNNERWESGYEKGCLKYPCGKIECDGSSKLVIGGEDGKVNNKGNNEGDYIEYDAKKLEDYLKDNLKCDGKGVKRIKDLLDRTPKDGKGRVLLSANCYKGGTCDCKSAMRYADPFIDNTDRMSICGENDQHKHSLGNPYHTGESYQNNYMSRRMKNQHIITIYNPAGRVEWCFVKMTTNICKVLTNCPTKRRRRLLDRGDCGS
jgi:hypothetical protein